MRTKTKISLRIDDDLLKVLKANSTGNLTSYIESLILKGLITDLAEVNQQIKFGKDFKNFVNNRQDEFEKEMKNTTTELLQMNLMFEQVSATGGYINKGVFMQSFNESGINSLK